MDGCSETWLTHAIGIFGLRGRGGDAMVGEVDHVAAAGVRGAVRARGGEPSRVVSAVWHQCDHRLRAAGAAIVRRGWRTGRGARTVRPPARRGKWRDWCWRFAMNTRPGVDARSVAGSRISVTSECRARAR